MLSLPHCMCGSLCTEPPLPKTQNRKGKFKDASPFQQRPGFPSFMGQASVSIVTPLTQINAQKGAQGKESWPHMVTAAQDT